MSSPASPQNLLLTCVRAARIAALLAVLVALIDVPALALPGILAAAAGVLGASLGRRRTTDVAAGAAAAVGVLAATVGELAPAGAAAFVLLATGLLVLGRPVGGRQLAPAVGAVTATLALGALAAIGHSFAQGIDASPGATGAVGLLGTAIILLNPGAGLAGLLTSPHAGGAVARRLLPVAVGAPLAIDLLRIGAVEAGLLPERAGDWLFACGVVAAFSAIVVVLARSLDRADRALRKAVNRLVLSEAHARQVSEQAHDAIVCADALGRVTVFNAAAARLFGLAASDVLGGPFTRLLETDDPERVAREFAGYLDGGASLVLERAVRVPGGGERLVEISLSFWGTGSGRQVTAVVRDVTVRRHAEDAARADAERLVRVVAAQTAIAAAGHSFAQTLDGVAAQAAEAVGADGAVVEMPEGDELVYRSASGVAVPHLGFRVSAAGSLSGEALRTGLTLHCADTETDPRVDRAACRRVGVRSMICVPLRHHQHIIGVIKVLSGVPDAFSARDERTLELLAGMAATAVHRAQAERRLAAHHAVARALTEADSLEGGISGALHGLAEGLGWRFGAVWLADDAGAPRFVEAWQAATLPGAGYVAAARALDLHTGADPVARAWGECALQWVADPAPSVGRGAQAAASGLRTILAVPIVSRGETLGVLELGARERLARDGEVVELLGAIATQLGQFAQRKRAEERLAGQAANLRAAVELTRRLSRAEDPAELRHAAVATLRAMTSADQVSILERDAAGVVRVTAQSGDHLRVGLAVEGPGPSVVLDALATGHGSHVTDLGADPRANMQLAQRSGLRSTRVEPLMRDGRAIGVLAFAWVEPRPEVADGLAGLAPLLAGEVAGALERAALVARLESSARTDQLTGVANRRAWDEELPRELARARRAGAPLTVAIIDLDHFKAYNDEHGHPAGDRLLREASAAWSERLRATDLLARHGGEEFAVLLPGCQLGAAHSVLEALRVAMPAGTSCSIGVVEWDGSEVAGELVARADAALYAAKRAGRDRVVAAA